MSETLKAGDVVLVNGAPWTLEADVAASPVAPPALYPKLLWSKEGHEVTAPDAEAAEAFRADGYVDVNPLTVPPEAEPTFGPPDDPTHAKR